MRTKIYQMNITIDEDTLRKMKRIKEQIGLSYSQQLVRGVGGLFQQYYNAGLFYTAFNGVGKAKSEFDVKKEDPGDDDESLEEIFDKVK